MYPPAMPLPSEPPLKHSNPPFQRKPYFAPRGRGPRYGQNPYYRPQPRMPMQNYNKEEHWCETCDRGFPNVDQLEKHKQQHQKCNIDGCQFIAHPKVITKHIQMQHSSGLFKKIANLNNPEEIKKWRDERKKKYPTKENVQKKAAETKEKIERGEKMGLKRDKDRFDRNKKSGPNQNQKQKHPFGREHFDKKRKITKHDVNVHTNKKTPKITGNIVPPIGDNRNLKPFAGIQHLIIDDDNDTEHHIVQESSCSDLIVDDEDYVGETIIKPLLNNEEPSVCGALSSLMCEYRSSDDETETANVTAIPAGKQTTSQKDKTNVKHQANPHIVTSQSTGDLAEHQNGTTNKNERQENDDDSGPEEVIVEKPVGPKTDNIIEQKETIKCDIKKPKNKIYVQSRKQVDRRPKNKVPSTLLQKLLHREIEQERNIVLQCIRHIVKNNYFDK